MARFQILPDLSADDYEALKADIADRGVQVPVEYDEDGNIIDGHHRERACNELGIEDWPKIIRRYADDAAKRTQARKLNLARRHLTTAQKRALIEDELKDNPERSNNAIAKELGVDHKTVGSVRERLEEGWEIPNHDTRIGRDGVEQPATKPPSPKAVATAAANSAAEAFLANADAEATIEDLRSVIRKAVDDVVGPATRASKRPPDPIGDAWTDWTAAVRHLSKAPADITAIANFLPVLRDDYIGDAQAAISNLETWISELKKGIADAA